MVSQENPRPNRRPNRRPNTRPAVSYEGSKVLAGQRPDLAAVNPTNLIFFAICQCLSLPLDKLEVLSLDIRSIELTLGPVCTVKYFYQAPQAPTPGGVSHPGQSRTRPPSAGSVSSAGQSGTSSRAGQNTGEPVAGKNSAVGPATHPASPVSPLSPSEPMTRPESPISPISPLSPGEPVTRPASPASDTQPQSPPVQNPAGRPGTQNAARPADNRGPDDPSRLRSPWSADFNPNEVDAGKLPEPPTLPHF